MKKKFFVWTLLSVLFFSLFSISCSKDDDDKDESYSVQICIENYRSDAVYFYINGEFKCIINGNKVYNGVHTLQNGDSGKFEVRDVNGSVLNSQTVSKGDSYYVVCSANGEDASNTKEEWSFTMEIANSSSDFIHVFIDGKIEKIIESGMAYTKTQSMVNQESISVVIKTSDGTILDSKTIKKGDNYTIEIKEWSFDMEVINSSSSAVHVFIDGEDIKTIEKGMVYTRTQKVLFIQDVVSVVLKDEDGIILDSKSIKDGESYTKTIKDPTFTITKMELTKWNRGSNSLDSNPDPYIKVLVDDSSVGETGYQSDVADGSACSWSGLKITINKISSKVSFKLYDYDIFSDDLISGVYTENFYEYKGKESFTLKTSSLEITVYGTWNY